MNEIDTEELRKSYGPHFGGVHDAVSAMCDEIDRLRGMLRRAGDALRPFDDVLGEDEPIGGKVRVTTTWGPVADYTLTVDDFRSARALTHEIEEALDAS